MIVVYNKKNGNLIYTIENSLEKPILREFEGLIEINQNISIGNFYFDIEKEKLVPKIDIELSIEKNILRIRAPQEEKKTKLTIANVESEKVINILLENGEKEIQLQFQSSKKTEIFIFTEKHRSNTIVLNDEGYLEGELII